jgi:hypothetical protein
MIYSMYWVLALAPALLHPLVFLSYRRTLMSKRAEVQRLMTVGNARTIYHSAFRREPDDLFQRLYGNWLYIYPLTITFCLTAIATVTILARAGVVLPGVSDAVVQKIAAIPTTAAAGIVGGFVWGLYDSLQRAQQACLTPSALHFVWFRLLIGASLAPLVVSALAAGLQTPAAFFVAALPVADLIAYAKKVSTERLGIDPTGESPEPPTLHHLQGLTAKVIDSLAGAGVDSTEHLAHADPINVLLRTNLSWKVILDLIDQALLFNYVGDKIQLFRPSGIRGSVEFAMVGESLASGDITSQERASALVDRLAAQTAIDRALIENAIQTMTRDLQVHLVKELWGTAFEVSREEEVRFGSRPAASHA